MYYPTQPDSNSARGRFAGVGNLRLILALAVMLPVAGLAAADPAPAVTPMGDNTFSITRQAKTTFDRDVEKFKAEVRQDAAAYCESQHKQLKVLTVTSERPFYSLGFTSATIVFKALDAGSPELAPAAESPAPARPIEAAPALSSAPSGDLYTELLKLDDLRKRGILTDKEFESEKKKLLKRSK